MPLCEWEETETCPYNNAHQISKSKLITHLVKCRRNNPNAGIEICSFNSSHHIPKDELAEHEKNCPSAKQLAMILNSPMSSSLNAPVSNVAPVNGIDDEDWEAEATIKKSYDPKKVINNRSVLRKIEGVTPSKRRDFRMNERVRLQELQVNSANTEKLSDQLSKTFMRDESRQPVPNFNNNDRPLAKGRGRGVMLGRVQWNESRNALGSVSSNQSSGSDATGNKVEEKNVPKSRGRGKIKWGTKN